MKASLIQVGTTGIRVKRNGEIISEHRDEHKASEAAVNLVAERGGDVRIVTEKEVRVTVTPGQPLPETPEEQEEEPGQPPLPEPEPEPPPTVEPEPKKPDPEPDPFPDTPAYGSRISEDRLRVHEGTLTVTKAGTVLQGILIKNGSLDIRAAGVVAHDVFVRSGGWYPIRIYPEGAGAILEHFTVRGAGKVGSAGMTGHDVIARFFDIGGMDDGIKGGRRSLYEDGIVHSPVTGPGAHSDGVQISSGGEITIRRVKIDYPSAGGANSAIIIKADGGPIDDVLIENCILNGGNYTFYSRRGSKYPAPTNIRLLRCRFGRDNKYGPTSIDGEIVREGNVWADTGEPM